jgi:hypothetical protein
MSRRFAQRPESIILPIYRDKLDGLAISRVK